jgi:choloylglycine hydrolase
MCTAITYSTKDHYFGRNLDLEHSYRTAVTITPRNYPLHFRRLADQEQHFAIIGMALVEGNYPLYFDATNEHGLSMAGLNFPGNAVYHPEKNNAYNVTPYELIPWILGQCRNVQEARLLLDKANILNIPFSAEYPLSPLHWILSDSNASVTIESMSDGLHVFANSVGVLTNNPPFDYHMHNLTNYLNVTSQEASNRFSEALDLHPCSRGAGSIGLPGDLSSPSRFIRAVFTKFNSISKDSESASVSQFFHILDSVAQTQGCAKVGNLYEKTLYSSCCNTTKCIYYYTTYENRQITGIRMHSEDLNGNTLICYCLRTDQQFRMDN